MKKIYLLILIIGAFSFQSCEGPEGPPGIDGLDGVDGVDGEDGGLFLSTVLETVVNFTAENEYQAGFGLEIMEEDNLLIYLALGADEEENIVWMPLPQTFFVGEGMVIYNFFFTKDYFSIFLDSSVPPADLDTTYTENRYFRIVIVPGEYPPPPPSARVDLGDYHAVMKWLGKDETDIVKIEPE